MRILKRALWLLAATLLVAMLPTRASARERAYGFCTYGGTVSVSNLPASNPVMTEYPTCTVTVYFAGLSAAQTISTLSRTGNTVTLTLATLDTTLGAGATVTVAGASDSSFDGTFTLTGVNNTGSTSVATYSQTGTDATATGGTATFTPLLYSDNNGTTQSNPFTASDKGYWYFYADDGRYDVTISGGNPAMPSPFTYGDIELISPAVGGALGGIQVNGSPTTNSSSPYYGNFNSTTPAAPSGAANVVFQHDSGNPENISGYVPQGTTTPYVQLPLSTFACGSGDTSTIDGQNLCTLNIALLSQGNTAQGPFIPQNAYQVLGGPQLPPGTAAGVVNYGACHMLVPNTSGTCTITLPNPTTAGDALIGQACVNSQASCQNGSSTFAVTGDTFAGVSGTRESIATSIVQGSTKVTCNLNGGLTSGQGQCIIVEINNFGSIDTTGTGSSSTSYTATTGTSTASVTTTSSTETLVDFAEAYANAINCATTGPFVFTSPQEFVGGGYVSSDIGTSNDGVYDAVALAGAPTANTYSESWTAAGGPTGATCVSGPSGTLDVIAIIPASPTTITAVPTWQYVTTADILFGSLDNLVTSFNYKIGDIFLLGTSPIVVTPAGSQGQDIYVSCPTCSTGVVSPTFQTNSVNNASANGGLNFLDSTADAIGLHAAWTNPSGTEERVEITGAPTALALTSYTVGTLPSASANSGHEVVVTDGTSGSDCTAGGGTDTVLCRSNGTIWASLGGGAGSSISVNGAAVASPNFNDSSPAAPSGDLNVKWQNSGSNVSAYISNTTPFVNVANYGATGVGGVVYDAAMASTGGTLGATGTNTSPTPPGGTTTFSNELVLYVYGFESTLTGPSGPTNRVYFAGVSGTNDGLWIGDSTIATPGSFTGPAASQSGSTAWSSINLPFIPTAGNTIAFVADSTGTGNSTISLNVPTGTAAGNAMVACLSFYPGSANGDYYITPGGWSPLSINNANTASGESLNCWAKIASASEPASYTWTLHATSGGGNAGGAILTYTNVAALDQTLTSATASFTSATVDDPSCINIVDPQGGGSVCGQLGYYSSSTTMYPLFGNPTTAAVSSTELRFAHNDTSAFNSAITALETDGGGTLYVPAGTFGLTSALTFPTTQVINIEGAGEGSSEYVTPTGAFGTFTPVAANGTTLQFLTNSLTTAALIFPQTTTYSWVWVPLPIITDFSMWAGAGTHGNGGGSNTLGGANVNGISSYWQNIEFDRISVSNFSGDGLLVSSNGGTASYTALVTVRHCLLQLNGANGLHLGGGTYFNQNLRVIDNQIVSNGEHGILVDGAPLIGAIFDNNIVQWDNRDAANPGYEIYATEPMEATTFRGNWVDGSQVADTSAFGINYSTNYWQGPRIVGNWIQASNTGGYGLVLTGVNGFSLEGNYFDPSTTPISPSSTFSMATVSSNRSSSTNDNTNNGVFATQQTGTSGKVTCHENGIGGSMTVSCSLAGYAQTGTAQTWTFPISFAEVPVVLESGGSCGTYNPTATATVLTFPANSSMTAESCTVVLQGDH